MRHSTSIKLASIALAVAGLGSASASIAATATGSLSVTAVVLSTCIVVSTPVIFGGYTLAALDTSGLITVTCTPDVLSYNVALDAGTGTGATTASRKLTATLSPTDTLNYALYRDSGRTLNWGEQQNVDTLASSGATTDLGAIKTFAVYGRLSANQTGAIGAYLDTVQITVNY